MKRHAYLIMAHDQFGQLGTLLTLLDHCQNDVYIHIDKKSVFTQEDRNKLLRCADQSMICFVDPVKVSWGSDKVVKAELMLLEAAAKGKYDYYHLISGADLPLKTQDEIHAFFDQHKGFEFLSFSSCEWRQKFQKRIRYYWIFQDIIGNPKRAIMNKKMGVILLLAIQRGFVEIQKLLYVDRRKKHGQQYYSGSNWFSISHDLVEYVLARKDWIIETFRYTLCADEMFLQTVVGNSPFYDKRYILERTNGGPSNNLRYIDWKRGYPYVFKSGDFEELIHSGALFARKFSEMEDAEIIEKIAIHLKQKSNK